MEALSRSDQLLDLSGPIHLGLTLANISRPLPEPTDSYDAGPNIAITLPMRTCLGGSFSRQAEGLALYMILPVITGSCFPVCMHAF